MALTNMITQLKYQISEKIFRNLKNEIPEFEHRIDLNIPTGNFFYDKWEMSSQFKDTVWETVLECLPFPIGEARLMKLEPGSAYYSHADIDDRYHLNITGNRSFLVDLDNNILHPIENNGYWYEMNAGRRHSAVNFGNETRVQLVVRKLLQKNILTDAVPIKISLEYARHDYRYVFDDVYSPVINLFIKNGIITDFSIKNEEVYFSIEKSFIDDINNIVPEGFKVTVCQ